MTEFVTTLVLRFKKIGSDDETKYCTVFCPQKQKQLLMKMTLMVYLNQAVVQFINNTQISRIRFYSIIDSVIVILLIFQSRITQVVAVMSNYQNS